ncbi:hypothetical protein J6590_050752 [Homalodisca vitripennis]|nr:hypothetical protein J6590_050752 [Homalodisca vitripennis]
MLALPLHGKQVPSTRYEYENHTSHQHKRTWDTNTKIDVGFFSGTASYHLKQWGRKEECI